MTQPQPQHKATYEQLEAQVLEDAVMIDALRNRCRGLREQVVRLGKENAVLKGLLDGGRTDEVPPIPPRQDVEEQGGDAGHAS